MLPNPSGPSRPIASAGVILVVEDAADLRSCVSEFFRLAGFEVVETANAQEAQASVNSDSHIDLVFSDIDMPGEMDGVDLAQWLAENHPLMPIILTSGKAHPELERAQGHRRFVNKPYQFGALENEVRELVEASAVH
jgi:two-component system, response regulator PdtaR